jgi:hypothetical protein
VAISKSYASQNFKIESISRDSTEECGDGTIPFSLNWDNLVQYTVSHQTIIDVPITESGFSLNHSLLGGSSTDSSASSYYTALTNQVERLLFVFDSSGMIGVSIMKISANSSSLQPLETCSFNNFTSNFSGIVQFVSPRDSILKFYQVQDGMWNESQTPDGLEGGATDRWDCITIGYRYTSCTGSSHHTWDQRASCPCGKTVENCSPPSRTPILNCPTSWFTYINIRNTIIPNYPINTGGGGPFNSPTVPGAGQQGPGDGVNAPPPAYTPPNHPAINPTNAMAQATLFSNKYNIPVDLIEDINAACSSTGNFEICIIESLLGLQLTVSQINFITKNPNLFDDLLESIQSDASVVTLLPGSNNPISQSNPICPAFFNNWIQLNNSIGGIDYFMNITDFAIQFEPIGGLSYSIEIPIFHIEFYESMTTSCTTQKSVMAARAMTTAIANTNYQIAIGGVIAADLSAHFQLEYYMAMADLVEDCGIDNIGVPIVSANCSYLEIPTEPDGDPVPLTSVPDYDNLMTNNCP